MSALLMTFAVLSGCNDVVVLEARMDGPAGAAVLHPDQGGPFYEPIGFVSNARNGRIWPLDLKHGWVVADDSAAPFLAGVPIPTGQRRILGDVVAYAPTSDVVTLFVADAFTGTLLEVPYVTGVDGDAPVEQGATVTVEPSFVDADGSGDAPVLTLVEARPGYATTESWTVTFTGSVWTVEGTRSGLQYGQASAQRPYASDNAEIEFVIEGTATEGDRFEFSIDTGIVEHDVGGLVQALWMHPEGAVMLASVYDLDTAETGLVAVDPATGALLGALDLPADSVPWRMSGDPAGDLVYVADARNPSVFELVLQVDDPSASAVRELAVQGPVADVAWQGDGDYEHLFVAVAGENRVDVFDLLADAWLDVNPYTEAVDGIRVESPVTGLAPSMGEVLLQEETTWGDRTSDEVVAISTFDGVMVLAEASTGCLAVNLGGPSSTADSDSTFSDESPASNPLMSESEATGQVVQVNPCGGLAEDEAWTATFDGAAGAWVVDGERAGEQANLAYEDERYVSDEGVLSFLILAGQNPSSHGDQYSWTVYDNVVEINGDLDRDGDIDQELELPARPVAYNYLAGATGGGWDELNEKTGVLWPLTDDNTVVRVNLQAAAIEVVWD